MRRMNVKVVARMRTTTTLGMTLLTMPARRTKTTRRQQQQQQQLLVLALAQQPQLCGIGTTNSAAVALAYPLR